MAATPKSDPRTPVYKPTEVRYATPPTQDDVGDTDLQSRNYRHLTDLYNDMSEVDEVEESGLCFLVAEDPATVGDALADAPWKGAMEEEMKSIINNRTWELTSLLAGYCAIRLKWIFKVKNDPTGNVIKHKARLVAKGTRNVRGCTSRRSSLPWHGWRHNACCLHSQHTAGGRCTIWTSSQRF